MPYIVQSSLDFSSKVIPSTREQLNNLIADKEKFLKEKEVEVKEVVEVQEEELQEHSEEINEEVNKEAEVEIEEKSKKNSKAKNRKVGEE